MLPKQAECSRKGFWDSFGVFEGRETALGRARLNNLSFYVCVQQVSLRGMYWIESCRKKIIH